MFFWHFSNPYADEDDEDDLQPMDVLVDLDCTALQNAKK